MHLSKKFVVVLSFSLLAAACGNSGESKPGSKDSAAGTSTTSPAATAASDKGLELIGASDCRTCHKINPEDQEGGPAGPMYTQVAAKYSPAADTTVNRLIKKIISGGSGIWGTTPMTPHAALNEADARTMVEYILSLKK